VKDGKQSRKIEISSSICVLCEILLLFFLMGYVLFALHLLAAQ